MKMDTCSTAPMETSWSKKVQTHIQSAEHATGTAHIYFASSDNSNPITNERRYTLYIPLTFITRSMGILYLVILLPGLIWFLYFSLAIPDHRKTLFHSPTGIFIVLDRFFEYFPKLIKPDVQLARQQIKTRADIGDSCSPLPFWFHIFIFLWNGSSSSPCLPS